MHPTQFRTVKNKFSKGYVFGFLAISFALLAIVHGAVLHHLLPILNDHGLSSEMAVLAASFLGPMQVAGRLAMMALEKHSSIHSIVIGAFLMMGLSVILLLFSGTSIVFLSAFVILFGGAYGTVSILRPLIARELLGERDFGAKTGALALPYLIGSASAPYLGTIIWGWGGYSSMLCSLIFVSGTGCILYLIAQQLSKKSFLSSSADDDDLL